MEAPQLTPTETTEREGLVSDKGETFDIIIISPSTFNKCVICVLDFSQCFLLFVNFFLLNIEFINKNNAPNCRENYKKSPKIHVFAFPLCCILTPDRPVNLGISKTSSC